MKKVLVLEDETDIRDFVVINFKRSGYMPIVWRWEEALSKPRRIVILPLRF